MKQTDVGGGEMCNLEVITFDCIYPFIKKNILQKCQQNMLNKV